jgi:hypothetical protein
MGRRFRQEYGARPLHLLFGLVALGLSGYAVLELFHRAKPVEISEWLVAAIILHDFFLLPFYSLLGTLAYRGLRVGEPGHPARLDALNHVRIAVFFVVLPLFIWAPLIFGLGERRYHLDTGLTTTVYLGRWLLYSLIVCLGSALLFAVRVRRTHRLAQMGRHVADRAERTQGGPGDLRAPAPPRVVGNPHLADDELLLGGPEDHLQRPAERPVAELEPEQGIPSGRAHRADIAQPDVGSPADFDGQYPVGQACVERPGPGARAAGPETEVGGTVEDRPADEGEVGGVE